MPKTKSLGEELERVVGRTRTQRDKRFKFTVCDTIESMISPYFLNVSLSTHKKDTWYVKVYALTSW